MADGMDAKVLHVDTSHGFDREPCDAPEANASDVPAADQFQNTHI